MYKKKSSVSRRNKEMCDGLKNWDTWKVGDIMKNDRRCYNYVCETKSVLLAMTKEQKLRAIRRNSSCGLGGANVRNVSAKELNLLIKDIDK